VAGARYAIVVHGGAGRWPSAAAAAALAGVRAAVAAGVEILQAGGFALDAVTAAVVVLEDDPLFNAGTGSVLNRDGNVEMDASIMDGRTLACGGVAAICRVRNPILVARKVMEETDHVLLAGAGAQRFAREAGFARYDPVTAARVAEYKTRLCVVHAQQARAATAKRAVVENHRAQSKGTVGAVALDRHGALAAATSTGGLSLKLPGRVGDSPIPGAGNYANVRGAASATGHGEAMIRAGSTRYVCERITAGRTAQQAAREGIARLRKLGAEGGLIAVDANGGCGIAHNSPALPHGFLVQGQADITVRMVLEQRKAK
jgi:L-asparaginase / beta-aspartyl-peptidase